MDIFALAREFHQAGYECLCWAKDATFELMDAKLHLRNAYSLGDLSMCPVSRRQWSSIYEAMQDTRPKRHKLISFFFGRHPKVTNNDFIERCDRDTSLCLKLSSS